MEEALDYIENLYSDYYQNQDSKSIEEIRGLALAKLKTAYNTAYTKSENCHTCSNLVCNGKLASYGDQILNKCPDFA